MTSILVLSESPEIEALLADLVVFAGYHPVLLREGEAVGDAVRERSIGAMLVDADHPMALNGECQTAASAAGRVALVYCGGSLSSGELQAFAEQRGAFHFPLPNGPKLLSRVLAGALRQVGREPAFAPDNPPAEMLLAVRAVARAQRLSTVARLVVDENRRLRAERDALFQEARAGRDRLHTAVMEYLQGLRNDGLPRERAVDLLDATLRETAEMAGAPELLATIGSDPQRWVDEAYCAA